MTLEGMLKCKSSCRVVIVQADHEDSLKAMKTAREEGLADFILIGNKDRISHKADKLKITLDGVEVRTADSDEEASRLAAAMADAGEVDVVMKGLVHTSIFTKALLNKERSLIPPGGLISHVGLVELPGLPHPFLLTDAAINISPDLNQKAVILNNAIAVCRSLGVDSPLIGCVAPVETVNPNIQSTVDAKALTERDFGSAIVEGPIALDAALSKEAADVKGIDSRIAGEPDILLFPDLDAANSVYKAFTFYPGCRSAGILAGLKVPVVLTSRSGSEEIRYLSLKLALMSAGG